MPVSTSSSYSNASIPETASISSLLPHKERLSRRLKEFKSHFPSQQDVLLLDHYSCAFQREILAHGRMFLTERGINFYANIFGWITKLSIGFEEIIQIEKKSTVVLFNNAIQITTLHSKMFFTSFVSRDSAFCKIVTCWRNFSLSLGLSMEQILATAKKASYGESVNVFNENMQMSITKKLSLVNDADAIFETQSLPSIHSAADSISLGHLTVKSMDELQIFNEHKNNLLVPPTASAVFSGKQSLSSMHTSTPSILSEHSDSTVQEITKDLFHEETLLLDERLFLNIHFLKKFFFLQDNGTLFEYFEKQCMFENVKFGTWSSHIKNGYYEWNRKLSFLYPIFLWEMKLFSLPITIQQEFLVEPTIYDKCIVLTEISIDNSWLKDKICIKIISKLERIDSLWSRIQIYQKGIEMTFQSLLSYRLIKRLVRLKMEQELAELHKFILLFSNQPTEPIQFHERKRRLASITNILISSLLLFLLFTMIFHLANRNEREIHKLIKSKQRITEKYSQHNAFIETRKKELQLQIDKILKQS